MEGTWSVDDLRRAFVAGAQWWEWQRTWATMWPSDRDKAELEAEARFPGGRPPNNGFQPTAGAGRSGTLFDESDAQSSTGGG